MRNKLISSVIITLLFCMPCVSFAKEQATTYIEPVIQGELPVMETEYPLPTATYETEYPLPEKKLETVNNYQTQGYDSKDGLKGSVVMVPAETVFTAATLKPINSQVMKIGENISFYFGSDFYYDNKLVAPAGSKINGTVMKAKQGRILNRHGEIEIKFTHIVTPYGQTIPVLAKILTTDGTGVLKAGTMMDVTKDYAKTVGVGAASGAVMGTVVGAISKASSVGEGAIYGTAVGGAMALIAAMFQRGDEIFVPQNAQFNIILEQPITYSPNSPY